MRYLIQFWYGSDCRWETEAEAPNEVVALTMALAERQSTWIQDGYPFRVEIHGADDYRRRIQQYQ